MDNVAMSRGILSRRGIGIPGPCAIPGSSLSPLNRGSQRRSRERRRNEAAQTFRNADGERLLGTSTFTASRTR
jgi:hypothetical protein